MFVNRSSGLQRLGPKTLTTQAKPLIYLGFWFDGTFRPMLSHTVPRVHVARLTALPLRPSRKAYGSRGYQARCPGWSNRSFRRCQGRSTARGGSAFPRPIAISWSRRTRPAFMSAPASSIRRWMLSARTCCLPHLSLHRARNSAAMASPDVAPAVAAPGNAFRKAFNARQAGVAPDYALCPADQAHALLEEARARPAERHPSLRANDH